MIMNSCNHKMSYSTYTKVFQKGKSEMQFSCFSGITQRNYFLLTSARQNWASLIYKCWSLVCEDINKRVKLKLSSKHYDGRINIQSLILWRNWPLLYTYIVMLNSVVISVEKRSNRNSAHDLGGWPMVREKSMAGESILGKGTSYCWFMGNRKGLAERKAKMQLWKT